MTAQHELLQLALVQKKAIAEPFVGVMDDLCQLCPFLVFTGRYGRLLHYFALSSEEVRAASESPAARQCFFREPKLAFRQK